MYAFLAIVVQTGQDHKPGMKLYWTTDELYCVPFFSTVMPCDRFLKILKYLHFTINQNPPTQDREAPNYDRLWKI
jgi:hypothetical protein